MAHKMTDQFVEWCLIENDIVTRAKDGEGHGRVKMSVGENPLNKVYLFEYVVEKRSWGFWS